MIRLVRLYKAEGDSKQKYTKKETDSVQLRKMLELLSVFLERDGDKITPEELKRRVCAGWRVEGGGSRRRRAEGGGRRAEGGRRRVEGGRRRVEGGGRRAEGGGWSGQWRVESGWRVEGGGRRAGGGGRKGRGGRADFIIFRETERVSYVKRHSCSSSKQRMMRNPVTSLLMIE
jgi:hypothetical protein